MKHYYRNLRAGLCPMCGRERDAEGFYCQHCLEGNRRRGAKVTTEAKSRYQQTYRTKNRRQGLCSECGQVPEPGRKRCRKCLNKEADRRRRRKGLDNCEASKYSPEKRRAEPCLVR